MEQTQIQIRDKEGRLMTTTSKPKRTGVITCGVCGNALIQANHFPAFVCPDPKCVNSEERWYE